MVWNEVYECVHVDKCAKDNALQQLQMHQPLVGHYKWAFLLFLLSSVALYISTSFKTEWLRSCSYSCVLRPPEGTADQVLCGKNRVPYQVELQKYHKGNVTECSGNLRFGKCIVGLNKITKLLLNNKEIIHNLICPLQVFIFLCGKYFKAGFKVFPFKFLIYITEWPISCLEFLL